jgi:hypothetical protein
VTVGGVIGRVTAVSESYVTLEIADKVEVKVQKNAVSVVLAEPSSSLSLTHNAVRIVTALCFPAFQINYYESLSNLEVHTDTYCAGIRCAVHSPEFLW